LADPNRFDRFINDTRSRKETKRDYKAVFQEFKASKAQEIAQPAEKPKAQKAKSKQPKQDFLE
jgi:hypothetical protein|tara:strand:- start:295 stop:483 length:189 start_codon:yes stop_codon:yes gene_type:complete